jgi:hypothetical protein
MRVVFLSSPFFSYVHTFVFDPDEYNIFDPDVHNSTAEPAQLAQPTPMTNVEARPSSIHRDPLFTRLGSWVNRLTKEVVC